MFVTISLLQLSKVCFLVINKKHPEYPLVVKVLTTLKLKFIPLSHIALLHI